MHCWYPTLSIWNGPAHVMSAFNICETQLQQFIGSNLLNVIILKFVSLHVSSGGLNNPNFLFIVFCNFHTFCERSLKMNTLNAKHPQIAPDNCS